MFSKSNFIKFSEFSEERIIFSRNSNLTASVVHTHVHHQTQIGQSTFAINQLSSSMNFPCQEADYWASILLGNQQVNCRTEL